MSRSVVALLLLACGPKPTSSPAIATPPPRETQRAEPPPAEAPRDDRARLGALVADPASDADGSKRAALCAALGRSKDPGAIELLLYVLEQAPERQPAIVYREAITALGMLGASEATDAILATIFRVPEVASTQNVLERARLALAQIGPDAAAPLAAMLAGKHPRVAELAEAAGIEHAIVETVAMSFLALVIDGEHAAVQDIRDVLTSARCGRDPEQSGRFAFAAQALGRLGDAKSVAPICACLSGVLTPEPGYTSAEALAFIGGPEATRCLTNLIGTASYDRESVEPGFEHELRWEAVRLAALAGGPKSVPGIRAALRKSKSREVKKRAHEFAAMLDALERCTDEACAAELVAHGTDAFAREAAAFELARRQPRSPDAALAIANAFAVPNFDTRVSLAMLTRRLAGRGGCPPCADALATVLGAERGKMDARMQAAVLEARATIAVVSASGTDARTK
ncbi:MAG: hypothetical protein K1X88_08580 [Nannocystaceae bacterium]|nr:hypothetical protein [Nannocystaceae bacterium]